MFINFGNFVYCLVYELVDIWWKDVGEYLL